MPDMTKQLVVIARSEATKQSNEIATGSLSGALTMTKWWRLSRLPMAGSHLWV